MTVFLSVSSTNIFLGCGMKRLAKLKNTKFAAGKLKSISFYLTYESFLQWEDEEEAIADGLPENYLYEFGAKDLNKVDREIYDWGGDPDNTYPFYDSSDLEYHIKRAFPYEFFMNNAKDILKNERVCLDIFNDEFNTPEGEAFQFLSNEEDLREDKLFKMIFEGTILKYLDKHHPL